MDNVAAFARAMEHDAVPIVAEATAPLPPRSGYKLIDGRKALQLYYANITMYGPKFRGWLESNASTYHGVLLTEVHQDDLSKAIRFLRKHGLIATGAKAKATSLGGTTGGVLTGLLSHLTFWFEPPTWAPTGVKMTGWDWSAVLV